MNAVRALLGLSLAVNAAMFVQWRRLEADAATSRPPLPTAVARPAPQLKAEAPIDPETWNALGPQGELREFVAQLRAQGYPPGILRAILQAQLRERFDDRFKPLLVAAAKQPYWRGGFGDSIDPQISIARRALLREMGENLRQLLGDEWMLTEGTPAELRRRYGNLSVDKIREVARINADYGDLRAQLSLESRGLFLPEDHEKIAYLEKERRADLARLLTPDELLNYDLHASSTAYALRYRLSAFEASEEEFRKLYALNRSLDARFGLPEAQTPEQRRLRAEAEKSLAPQIEAALGPERYAEYKRTTEPAWIEAQHVVTRMGLPSAAIGQLASIQQDLVQRAESLRTDRKLPPDQRNTQLALLEREAVTRLTPVLGERLDDYRENGGGWLRRLKPSPPTGAR
jgi:hypothetical protein